MLSKLNTMLNEVNKEDYVLINRVKEARARHNLTQEDLARRVGVSRQTILFIETGKYIPSLFLALQIAEIFELDINDLFILERNSS